MLVCYWLYIPLLTHIVLIYTISVVFLSNVHLSVLCTHVALKFNTRHQFKSTSRWSSFIPPATYQHSISISSSLINQKSPEINMSVLCFWSSVDKSKIGNIINHCWRCQHTYYLFKYPPPSPPPANTDTFFTCMSYLSVNHNSLMIWYILITLADGSEACIDISWSWYSGGFPIALSRGFTSQNNHHCL